MKRISSSYGKLFSPLMLADLNSDEPWRQDLTGHQ